MTLVLFLGRRGFEPTTTVTLVRGRWAMVPANVVHSSVTSKHYIPQG
jgi:hypothetical protein